MTTGTSHVRHFGSVPRRTTRRGTDGLHDSPLEETGFEPLVPLFRKSLSAVAERRCRTDKLDGVIKHGLSHKTTMVGRGPLSTAVFLPSDRWFEIRLPPPVSRSPQRIRAAESRGFRRGLSVDWDLEKRTLAATQVYSSAGQGPCIPSASRLRPHGRDDRSLRSAIQKPTCSTESGISGHRAPTEPAANGSGRIGPFDQCAKNERGRRTSGSSISPQTNRAPSNSTRSL